MRPWGMLKRGLLWASLFFAVTTGRTAGETWVVNSTVDSHDAVPGDGICGDPLGADSTCSLRAAIEEANSNGVPDTILVPASLSPVRLTLESLMLLEGRTVIRATGGSAIIDGVAQRGGTDMLRIRSRGNGISGLVWRRARANAIVIEADSNLIGGPLGNDGNTIVGAGVDGREGFGILIRGDSGNGNVVQGNYVGLMRSGGVVLGNRVGVGIFDGAARNLVGGTDAGSRNIISGNVSDGLVIAGGAHENAVAGNLIGPDQSGIVGPGNGGCGVSLRDGAYENIVGGAGLISRNYLCANQGDGILLEGNGTEKNQILGNSIGLDITGYVAMANAGDGIAIREAAARNLIGSVDSGTTNLITGNLGHGISITGTGSDATEIRGCYIGFDSSGYGPIGNGEFFAAGIYVGEAVRGTVIGGTQESERNYFAYNLLGGIYLDGADESVIQGNYIGVSLFSLSSGYNGNGVVLRNGASGNLIGGSEPGAGNVISGNLMDEFPFGAGVLLADPGTSDNRLFGNMIGVDASGSRRMANSSAGVVIAEGASRNRIGGPGAGEGNIISGNGYATTLVSVGRGVHLYGNGTRENLIQGNLIGVGSDSLTAIPNLGNGVAVMHGASDNQIGGNEVATGNLVAENRCHGVLLQSNDTKRNLIRYNRILDNDSLGIAIREEAQDGIPPPDLLSFVEGEVRGTASPLSNVDIYIAKIDPSDMGEGAEWLAMGEADSAGGFAIDIPALSPDQRVTAIATDRSGNSSAFAANLSLDLVTGVDGTVSPRSSGFRLGQNFPNPFNPATNISFSLPSTGWARLSIYNSLGEEVVRLVDGIVQAGEAVVSWDGRNRAGNPVASGIYWYRLETPSFQQTRKMLLLK